MMELLLPIVILVNVQILFACNILKYNENSIFSEDKKNSHDGHLYPQESELRNVKSLDGLWDFAIIPKNSSNLQNLQKFLANNTIRTVEIMQMPVPSSFNDIITSSKLTDDIDAIWYARNFFVPYLWQHQRVFIRFGAVNHYTRVWINGHLMKTHKVGNLPFEIEISSNHHQHLKFGKKNRIVVVINSRLHSKNNVSEINNKPNWTESYPNNFSNYAGIHRPVILHTKPQTYIEDITVHTDIENNSGIIKYNITPAGFNKYVTLNCLVAISDKDGKQVLSHPTIGFNETIRIPNATLWWPRGMSSNPGYMYTLVSILAANQTIVDIYRLPVGIRTLKWTNSSFLINNKPVYMRGFGRRENSVLHGHGLDLVTMTKDYELLKWVGANTLRTHYSYSDEDMDMADREGFLIINECLLADTNNYSSHTLSHHKSLIEKLIHRDKNRPSVIMWSVTNELHLKQMEATEYFGKITKYTRHLDPTRPITAVLPKCNKYNTIGSFLDIISISKYNAWYHNIGRLDMIMGNIINNSIAIYKKFGKPLLMSAYGADAATGLHELPATAWSEEYQISVYSKHFQAFDFLRKKDWFIGELISYFTDLHVPQVTDQASGSKKGIFTRTRRPKMSAYYVRRRYHALGVEFNEQKSPDDVKYYITKHHVNFKLISNVTQRYNISQNSQINVCI